MSELIEEYGATIAVAIFGLLVMLGLIAVIIKIAQSSIEGVLQVKDMIEEYGSLIAAGLGGVIIVGILAMVMIPGNPINKLLVAVLP